MKNLLLVAIVATLFSTSIFAETLNCGGTEPFWGLTLDTESGKASYSDPMAEERVVIKRIKMRHTANDTSVRYFQTKKIKEFSAWVSITDGSIRGFCSDGMSDFDYIYEIFMNYKGIIFTGCCDSELRPRQGGE